jgi:hypothetical protein
MNRGSNPRFLPGSKANGVLKKIWLVAFVLSDWEFLPGSEAKELFPETG